MHLVGYAALVHPAPTASRLFWRPCLSIIDRDNGGNDNEASSTACSTLLRTSLE
jgi:hypothetical protein